MPVQAGGLRRLAISPAVQANLGYEQWPVASEVLETRKIGVVVVPRFQKNVEAQQVQKGQVQVFRWRIVGIRNQSFRVFFLYFAP